MAETHKLTVLMDYQDGQPFSGWLEVRLSDASKADAKLVGPRVWQEIPFDAEGKAEADLYPNSALEEGTYYKARIYASKVASGYKSKALLVDALFTMPDEDAFLHDLAVIEPVRPSAEDVLRTVASEAVQAASSAASSAESAAAAAAYAEADAIASAEIDALFV